MYKSGRFLVSQTFQGKSPKTEGSFALQLAAIAREMTGETLFGHLLVIPVKVATNAPGLRFPTTGPFLNSSKKLF